MKESEENNHVPFYYFRDTSTQWSN